MTAFRPGDLVAYTLAYMPHPRPAIFVRYTTPKRAIVRLVTGTERVVLVHSLRSLMEV